MHVSVNGVRLFFDVEGAKFVPDGPVMREKPVLLMLHGGPGADHSIYRPAYSALADIAQIVYLDHRGNGRSEDGPRERWNLAQWGDDVHAFCEALGIVGSDRARRLLRRHGGLVLCYPPSRPPFEADPDQHRRIRRRTSRPAHRTVRTLWRPGSRRAGAAALSGDTGPRPGLARRLGAARHPALFSQAPRPGHGAPRRQSAGGLHWFTRPGGEGNGFDLSGDLHRIQCPTLVLGGEDDPMHPIESQADIAAALPPHLVQFERFADCGHACMPDAPERTLRAVITASFHHATST